MKKVAIVQSSYLPWKGYFDLIHDVECFIFLDNVQMTNRDWRNRNRIKSSQGLCWMTIPVGSNQNININEVKLGNHHWQKDHYKMLTQYYARTPYLTNYQSWLKQIYLEKEWTSLSMLNQSLIKEIALKWLGMKTSFVDADLLSTHGHKTERLIGLLEQVGATHYISGPSAKDYIDEKQFEEAGIKLEYKQYGPYRAYDQVYPPFEHQVSIMDLLFHTGPEAPRYIWK